MHRTSIVIQLLFSCPSSRLLAALLSHLQPKQTTGALLIVSQSSRFQDHLKEKEAAVNPFELLELLLSHGADVDAANYRGHTVRAAFTARSHTGTHTCTPKRSPSKPATLVLLLYLTGSLSSSEPWGRRNGQVPYETRRLQGHDKCHWCLTTACSSCTGPCNCGSYA